MRNIVRFTLKLLFIIIGLIGIWRLAQASTVPDWYSDNPERTQAVHRLSEAITSSKLPL